MAQKDLYKNYRFLVEIDGIVQAGFEEVTIPYSLPDPIDYRENSNQPTMHQIPGLLKYGHVTLKRGITNSMDLYNWCRLVEDAKIKEARKNMAIIVLNEEKKTAARWEFESAWPTKYVALNLKAPGNELSIESIEVTHEGMKRI